MLRLFVTGFTPRSAEAIDTLHDICETELKGRYNLEIVDLSMTPELARSDDIVATPTLIKELPLPLRRLIGDLSDRERVLVGLGLSPKQADHGT